MKASEVITDVAKIVQEREATHGDIEVQFQIAADMLTAYLRGRGFITDGGALKPWDVAEMMVLMKTSRKACGTPILDHDQDIIGYAGIAAQLTHQKD